MQEGMSSTEITDNLSQSFNYAIKLTRNVGNLIILVILNLIPIVNFIIIGYAARILREGPEEPPVLDRFGDAFIEGLKVIVVAIIYFIIPALIAGIVVGLAVIGFLTSPHAVPTMFTPWYILTHVWAGIAFVTVIAFLFSIIATMGIIHMIVTKSFSKAFSFSEILKLIEKVGWGRYLLWLVVMFVIGLIISSLGNIPWIGWIISSAAGVFYLVFFARSAYLIYPYQETGS